MTGDGWPQAEGADALLLLLPEGSFPGDWPERIGVAVSGGSDSLALLHLFARIQAHRGGALHAVTVDHRLRPEATAEARFVAGMCAGLGVSHDTLVWDHGRIDGNLQDQARRARYGLIGAWARDRGIGDVVLGHTADDQAETFLMGLARGAGIDGLCGMRRKWEEGGIRWLRPYLTVPRADLRAYLTRHGITWVDDPSNADDRFQRVKARKVLAALKPLGITVEGLSAVTDTLSIAQGALKSAAVERASAILRSAAGEVILDRQGFRLTHPETARRILIAALRWVSSAAYAPRAAQMERLQQAIRQGRDATLWGCRLRVGGAEIRITREPKAVAHLATPTDAIWDGRWRLTGPHHADLRIRALGAEGLRASKAWRDTGISRAALVVSPAVWRGKTLVAAPFAGHGAGWTAEIVTGQPSTLITH